MSTLLGPNPSDHHFLALFGELTGPRRGKEKFHGGAIPLLKMGRNDESSILHL
jgi:hypothetical protein